MIGLGTGLGRKKNLGKRRCARLSGLLTVNRRTYTWRRSGHFLLSCELFVLFALVFEQASARLFEVANRLSIYCSRFE